LFNLIQFNSMLQEEREEAKKEEKEKLKQFLIQEYIKTFTAKEIIACEISSSMLKIKIEDTIGFQKYYKDHVNKK